MTSTMAGPAPEEGKLLSEALSTVKIQVQQMKRHLVSDVVQTDNSDFNSPRPGIRPAYGRIEEC